MKIHPEVIVTPDCPTVVLREPIEVVNLDVTIPNILNQQGWGIGTYFNIQYISHDRTKLIAEGKFVVTESSEVMHTSNPDGFQPMTKPVTARKAQQIGDWFYAVAKEPQKKTTTKKAAA